MLISSFCSPWGNRTPLARMKILSTNRYTNGPSSLHTEGFPLVCGCKFLKNIWNYQMFFRKNEQIRLNIFDLFQIPGYFFVFQLIIHQIACKILIV